MAFVEKDTLLNRLNPLLKFAALFVLMVVPALFFNPAVPGIFLAVALIMGVTLGKIHPGQLFRSVKPAVGLAAGIVIFYALAVRGGAREPLWRIGPLAVYGEGALLGAVIGLRLFCFAAFTLLFVQTTDPSLLTASLIRQARLPDRLAYTILAAYRFLPVLTSELDNIRAAHRVRGAFERRGLAAALARLKRYGVPLLASGVRQAERLSLAMEARGFAADQRRSHYHRPRLRRSDWLFVAAVLVLVVGLLLLLGRLGLLQGFLAGPAEEVAEGARRSAP